MHSPKQRDPAADRAIQAFLSNGGSVTRVSPSQHGTCERKKGIQFGGKPADQVRMETQIAARQEQERRQWINEHGGMKQARALGIKPPWEDNAAQDVES